MKIVHIITGLGLGGAESWLYKLLTQLEGRHANAVISLRTPEWFGPRIEALGVPVETLDLKPGIPDPLAVFRLARRLRRHQPTVVQTWMYHADLLGGLAARSIGIRALAWGVMQANLSPAVNSRSTLAVVRACALLSRSLPARIVSVSETARRSHVAAGYRDDRFTVLPVGFDLEALRPDPTAYAALRAELGFAPDARVVGLVGRHDPQKDHAGFIEAAGLVHRQRPDTRFVLAGSGVDAANTALADAVQRSGAAAAIHLLGRRDDIPSTIAGFDLFASSSVGEGFPNVVGEAMACGVPCVVTDVGDSAAIVGDTGRVVPPRDAPALARALLELLDSDLGPLGQRARTRVAEHYELGAVARRYEALYEELAKR